MKQTETNKPMRCRRRLGSLVLALLLLGTLCSCTPKATEPLSPAPTSGTTEELRGSGTTTASTTVTTSVAPTTSTTKKVTTAQLTTTRKPTTTRMATTQATQKEVGAMVYVTKTGKRWHRSSSCNGGTYYESSRAEAEARGLTPCKKCAGG